MNDHFRLCMHLDENGKPCNRRTTKPLTMCSLHRPKKPGGHSRKSDAEYQRKRRARLRAERNGELSVPAGWEAA